MQDGVTPQANAGLSHNNTLPLNSPEVGCACHSAQGYVKYIPQNAKGDIYYRFGQQTFTSTYPTVSTRTTGFTDAYQAAWTTQNAMPQTCTACHDPHNDANPNQLRVYNTLPLIASGIKNIEGVGKGAVCLVCHNLRSGDTCATAITATTYCPLNSATPNPSFTHEDSEIYNNGAPYNSVHDGPQGDVLLGRNAYFMDGNLPMLSKHAAVEDTCVGCHMTLNPNTHLSHGSVAVNTHSFYILDNQKSEFCLNCHGAGTVDGEAIVESTQTGLANLQTAIANYVAARINANLGGVYVKSGATYTTVLSLAATGVTATSDGSHVYLTAKGTGTFLGSFTNSTLYSNVGATALFFWDNTVSYTNIAASNKLSKAVWNYALINNDASFGIHNPSYVSAIIDATIAQMNNTTD
jgi:hypothetical protein